MSLTQLKQELKSLANTPKGKILSRFFKTGKGEYGEGDIFLGIKVPNQRKIAKKYKDLSLNQIKKLLSGKIHEHRLTALFILINKYQHGNEKLKKEIYRLYLKNTKYINNWDLVDVSAPKIVGKHLLDKPQKPMHQTVQGRRKILYKFAKSNNLWKKRIAILSTYTFIKNKQFKDTLKISRILLHDNHDLIHKAVGWMLREVGKIDKKTEEKFLKKHYKTMPRTMLRYAIERFSKPRRKFYLGK